MKKLLDRLTCCIVGHKAVGRKSKYWHYEVFTCKRCGKHLGKRRI